MNPSINLYFILSTLKRYKVNLAAFGLGLSSSHDPVKSRKNIVNRTNSRRYLFYYNQSEEGQNLHQRKKRKKNSR